MLYYVDPTQTEFVINETLLYHVVALLYHVVAMKYKKSESFGQNH